MIALPDGYILKKRHVGRMMGGEWDVEVYWRKSPADYAQVAFEMTKQYDPQSDGARYAGRFPKGKWQEYQSLKEMVMVMCSKHRIGVQE